jgi:tetratricopeptide (TPR) repeat protein
MDETPPAVRALEEALLLFRESQDRAGEGLVLASLGWAYLRSGNAKRAAAALKKAWVLLLEAEDRRGQAFCQGYLAAALAGLGDRPGAREAYEKSMQMAHALDDHGGNGYVEAQIAWALGRTLAELGDYDQAVELMKKRVEYEDQAGHLQAGEHRRLLEETQAKAEGVPFGGDT